jgi:sugar O-acyltransferase (sialic acid O-acetyltransferase NeuD family)
LIERPLLIVGTGDHARVVIDLARACGRAPAGCLAPPGDGSVSVGGAVDGVPVIGVLGDDDDGVGRIDPGTNFVVAIGNNERRRTEFARCLQLGMEPAVLVHPSATVLGHARIEPGAQVCAGAVVGIAASVGRNAIINTGATIDHDNVIAEHAMIGPGAHLAGRVTVDEGAWVGIGAVVRQGIQIGSWSLVGAGAVVVRDVAAAAVVAGVPATPMVNRSSSRQER